MGVKISETTKWTINAQVDPTDRDEGIEYMSVSAGKNGKIVLTVDDGDGQNTHTYLGPKGTTPVISVKVEWKDKSNGDVVEDDGEEEVRRPGKDWFGSED